MAEQKRIVIIGGGFGGLNAAQALRNLDVTITLIDKRNFHLFQPLLYQVATGALSPANIAAPLRAILRRQANVTTVLGEVVGIDAINRQVLLAEDVGGEQVPYDILIVAAGVRYSYFGHEDWRELAPSLKTIEDATTIRQRVLLAFEQAEKLRSLPASAQDAELLREYLTFVVVGGGPTGVELAGALGEIAHHTLQHDFRSIDPAAAQILLVEGADRVLAPFAPASSARAAADLQALGVTVRTGAIVTHIAPDGVTIKTGEQVEVIRTRTVLWAAGVQGVPLARQLATATNTQLDRAGRLPVQPDCTLPGHPEIFVIGDLANFSGPGGKPLPGVAPVAIQQGQYVAQTIRARLAGASTWPPFAYHDRGNMATIGRAAAVAEIGGYHIQGFIGWLTWLFVHLLYLVQFENRVLVLWQWAWNYWTRNRSARLITGQGAQLSSHQGVDAPPAASHAGGKERLLVS